MCMGAGARLETEESRSARMETVPHRVTRATLMRSGGRGSHGVFPPAPTTVRETAMYWMLFGKLSFRFVRAGKNT